MFATFYQDTFIAIVGNADSIFIGSVVIRIAPVKVIAELALEVVVVYNGTWLNRGICNLVCTAARRGRCFAPLVVPLICASNSFACKGNHNLIHRKACGLGRRLKIQNRLGGSSANLDCARNLCPFARS